MSDIRRSANRIVRALVVSLVALAAAAAVPAIAADTINVYSIWPENWARPMFAEFTPPLADRYIQRFSNGFDSIDFSRSEGISARSLWNQRVLPPWPTIRRPWLDFS